ncbi:hypothetical protein K5V07_14785 [Flavobacterium sp. CHNK8]|jgi:hypothetical protein|uniref:hypothetical protein n=1 Tax=unclassified Flavobacterium TaxID=196869 RepID=UPI000A387B15|nr:MULTISPECIES: hypothetical protein [unclassified Flavobacterium]OUD35620.1 hypothetical protein FPG59_09670 [Flavobacterium sp. FPG59]QZK91699.1 hypothetical protein K5V07_14785 [Flavobacterium sp. CHNK8]
MKYSSFVFLMLVLLVSSCKDEVDNRVLENKKEVQKQEVILKNIQKNWNFYDTPLTDASEKSLSSWNEFRLFLDELSQKPKNTANAYQRKAKALSKKAIALQDRIPFEFDKPQIKSRIATLVTKVRMLDLFIHLDQIPDKKVVLLIAEINLELVSLQRQMDKIVEKSKIPLEEGESELRRMLDSTRAIPNTPIIDPNIPRVE